MAVTPNRAALHAAIPEFDHLLGVVWNLVAVQEGLVFRVSTSGARLDETAFFVTQAGFCCHAHYYDSEPQILYSPSITG